MSKLAQTSQPPFPAQKPPKQILWWVPGDSGVELLFPWHFQPPGEGKERGAMGWILQWWAQRLREWQWHQKTQETDHLSYRGVIKVGKDLLDGRCTVLSLNSPIPLGGSCTVPPLPPAHLASSLQWLPSPQVSPGQEDDEVVAFKGQDDNFSLKSPPSDLSLDVAALGKCFFFPTINGWAQSQAVTEPCQHLQMEGSTELMWLWLNLTEHTAKIPK